MNFDLATLTLSAMRLVQQYAHFADHRDFDGFAELFEDDAEFAMGKHRWEGRAAIRAMLESGYPPSKVGRHVPGVPLVERHGDVVAAITPFQYLEHHDGSWSVRQVGRYEDELIERTDGTLGIRRRRVKVVQ